MLYTDTFLIDFYQFCFVRKLIFISFLLITFSIDASDKKIKKNQLNTDSIIQKEQTTIDTTQLYSLYKERLDSLNSHSPMDLRYNSKVKKFIDNYLGKNKRLVAKMQGVKQLYFSVFEGYLDKYNLPLEFKYLAIVESALNPTAKSSSGATGLWQFMYLTGKEYGLNVTSYIDERQDIYKSTEAACVYFTNLYEIFGDWNLVLAAYNGGPGYIQRKINQVGSYDFWELHPYLRRETRNYVPKFIAVNYVMNYAKEHGISAEDPQILICEKDTLILREQVELKTLIEILCVNKQTMKYLNSAYKKDIFPKGSTLTLPSYAVNDFLNNEEANYNFIDAVENKQILIDEERVVYIVRNGDYLGRIAQEYEVHIYEIKKWNNLRTTKLDIGDELVLYKKKKTKEEKIDTSKENEYIIQKGDTLWDIARQHKGLSVWKIKALNNLESDKLKPGTKIILPAT